VSATEVSGVDLARVLLRAEMEAAGKNGGQKAERQQQRPVRTERRDGRRAGCSSGDVREFGSPGPSLRVRGADLGTCEFPSRMALFAALSSIPA
jgi:hypothetical protein